jgi:hypothetical protein
VSSFLARLRRQGRVLAACLGLAIVALGFMGSLVVCTQPCCGGHVKMTPGCERAAATAAAHACGCCAAKRDRGAGGPAERAAPDACGGCVHVALGVELAPPPEPVEPPAALPAPAPLALPPAPLADATARAPVHPPATGPPRCDARTALRATTLLLL